jgi:uncharacterized protein YjbI with pentapeptide repeats/DNA-binding LacI/PurR family transcriptional regulator
MSATFNDRQPQNAPNAEPAQAANEVAAFVSAFMQLEASFEQIAAISDPIKQEYELIQAAQRHGIPLESYRRMFEASISQNQTASTPLPRVLKPLKFLDQQLGDFVNWCQNISLYQLATVIGQVTLLLAVFSYFVDAPRRHQQAVNSAKQILRDRAGEPYNQDRVTALKFLTENCEDLTGIKAPQASMPQINLDNCRTFQLDADTFTQFPPRFWPPKPIALAHANLAGANLQGANLRGMNLQGANLAGANLADANLQGANLAGANLQNANLRRSQLQNANLTGANLTNSLLSRANLTNANLKTAIAPQSEWLWTNLIGANLYEINLSGANLNRADLRQVDFYRANLQAASFRHADLRNQASLREANVARADLRTARLWSVSQLERAQQWQQAIKDTDWQAAITQPKATPTIALIKSSAASIFDSYAAGMRAVQGAEILTVQSAQPGVAAEAKMIQQLVDRGVDAILLRPEDPERSVPAIQKAHDAGTVVITIGDCVNAIASIRYVFACYESDSFQMGYDLTAAMAKSMGARQGGQTLNVGVIDSVYLGRAYPYFQGFQQAMRDAGIRWNEVASLNAYSPTDLTKVKAMLQTYPQIQVLWGGTDISTEIAIRAVQELGLQNQVLVYGIVDLTSAKAKMLLDPHHPLQSIVDENPQRVGREATEAAIAILNGSAIEYQYNLIPHRLLGQHDRTAVQNLLNAKTKAD